MSKHVFFSDIRDQNFNVQGAKGAYVQQEEENSEDETLLIQRQPKSRSSKRMIFRPEKGMGPEMLYPEMMAHPPVHHRRHSKKTTYRSSGGWFEGTDSDDEYRKDPSKKPEDAAIQAYLVIAMVIAILAVLAAIKGYNIFHGTEEKAENRPKGGYW